MGGVGAYSSGRAGACRRSGQLAGDEGSQAGRANRLPAFSIAPTPSRLASCAVPDRSACGIHATRATAIRSVPVWPGRRAWVRSAVPSIVSRRTVRGMVPDRCERCGRILVSRHKQDRHIGPPINPTGLTNGKVPPLRRRSPRMARPRAVGRNGRTGSIGPVAGRTQHREPGGSWSGGSRSGQSAT